MVFSSHSRVAAARFPRYAGVGHFYVHGIRVERLISLDSCHVLSYLGVTTEQLKRVSADGMRALIANILLVGKEIGNEKAFRLLLEARAKSYSDKHIKWARDSMARLGIRGDDAIAAYELTEAFFEDTRMYTFGHLIAEPTGYKGQTEFVEKGPKRVVVRHHLWCPLLQACRDMGVETRPFCENFAFPEWEAVVKATVNPSFVLKANKIRPEADYCEEVYE